MNPNGNVIESSSYFCYVSIINLKLVGVTMFKPNKNVLNYVAAVIKDEAESFDIKMFKEFRRIDEETNQRGLFSSGHRIQTYRDFYHNDGKEFVVHLIQKIEQLQKEQELLYTANDWQAIEEELIQVCDGLYQNYIAIDDEAHKKMDMDASQTRVIINFRNVVSQKIGIAKRKTINKITKRSEIWLKRVNLLIPWISLAISLYALLKK
jgi:hypothetical protein